MKNIKFVNNNYTSSEWSESVSALSVSSLSTLYSVEFGKVQFFA